MTEPFDFDFRFAQNSDIPTLKKLWKCCFGDDDKYIDLFFAERFAQDICLAAFQGETAAAMLFLLPITAVCGEKHYPARYIYAVCTKPEFRNRSLSTRLLDAAHEYMAKNNIAMSLLVPAENSLFDYYKKRGFETEFYCREFEVNADAANIDFEQAELQNLFEERNRVFSNSTLYMQWDKVALGYQQKEAEFFGGKTLKFNDGYAVCVPYDQGVLIKEWGKKEIDEQIIADIARIFDKKRAFVRVPAYENQKGARPFAMTKWYISERKAKTENYYCFTLVLD